MENIKTPDFIIIDDDSINNHICEKYLNLAFPGTEVVSFTSPQAGLDFIFNHYSAQPQKTTILFLDINMPVLNGWDVLDRIRNFPDAVKKGFRIYILSSSVAHEDKSKADNDPLVSGFIEKPLSIAQLRSLPLDLTSNPETNANA